MSQTFSQQLVYTVGGTPGPLGFGSLAGHAVRVCVDEACAVPASDLLLFDGDVPVPDGLVVVDETSRTPKLKLPGDDITVLYAKVEGVTGAVIAELTADHSVSARDLLHTDGLVLAGSGPNVPGMVVPAGAMDSYFERRALATVKLIDLPGGGDSTLYGAGGLYSIMQRLRERFVMSLGLPDGGKGMFAGGEGFDMITYDSPGEVNGYVSGNYSGSPDQFDNTQGQYYYDTGGTPGHQEVLQFRTTRIRIWFTRRGNAGSFTYSVDGGPDVRVDAHSDTVFVSDFVLIDGLAPGVTHTVTLTELGGRPAVPPAAPAVGTGAPSSGTWTSGIHLAYKTSYVYVGGETLPSPASTVIITDGASRDVSITIAEAGQDSVKVYRSVNGLTGPFKHVPTADTRLGGSSSVGFYRDDAAYTDDGTTPAVTGTTNLNTAAPATYNALAPINEVGMAVQKYATSGNTMQMFLNTVTQAASWFGLVYDGSGPYDPASYTVDTSHPADERILPAIGMLQLGFNDLTGQSSTDMSVYINGVKQFAAMCQAAGCPGIISSGNLPTNPTKWTTYGALVQEALRNQAAIEGLIFVDLWTPLGAYTNAAYVGGGPHRSKAEYTTQADWLFDELLGL